MPGGSFLRNLYQVAAVGIGHPNAPGSGASGIERHMFAVRGILGIVLLTRRGVNLHRWSFGMSQVLSPDVDVVVGDAYCQFAPIERYGRPISCCSRECAHFATTHWQFLELVAPCGYLRHNQKLIITAPH